MPQMASMKRTPSKRKDADILTPSERDVFPTELFLGDDEVKKLNLTDAAMSEEMTLTAKVKVTSVSADETASGKRHRVTLSFREAGVERAGDKKKRAADLIFDRTK